MYIIYKHTNKINNAVYIGVTCKSMEKRWNSHVNSSKRGDGYKFQRAIAKYGEDAFIHEQLGVVCDLNEAKKLEIHYISLYNSFKRGYNSTAGGDLCYERDSLWREKKSIEMKEKHKSGELISPFSNSDTHQKTMDSRKRNGTNIFVTNNPMLNEETVMKKMISMPDMRGRKQWMNIVNGDRKQQTEHPDPIQDWVNIGFTKGISKNKGIPKSQKICPVCKKLFAVHTLSRHLRAKHESN